MLSILKPHGHMNTMKTLANVNYLLIKLLKNTDEQIFRLLFSMHFFQSFVSADMSCKWKHYMKYFKNQVEITRGLSFRIRKWIFLSHNIYSYVYPTE